MPVTINEFDHFARILKHENWKEYRDTVKRLTIFYKDLLMRMYPNHECRPRVEELLRLLNRGEEEPTYSTAWYNIPIEEKRHIINLANILRVVLLPPRPDTAVPAVGRLQRYYREGDERARHIVNEYLEMARREGNPQIIEPLTESGDIGPERIENIADYLHYQLSVWEIPYLVHALPTRGNANQVDNDIIPEGRMIVEGQAEPLPAYAGNEMYQRLVGVFNGRLRGPEVFNSIIRAFNLQGDGQGEALLAVRPLSVIAVNAPDGKRVYRAAVRMRGVSQTFIDQGLKVLLQSGAIEEVGETVRLTNPFKINLVNG